MKSGENLDKEPRAIELKNQVRLLSHHSYSCWIFFCQLAIVNIFLGGRIWGCGDLQSRIIRTTELAAAQEKLQELEKQKEELLKFYCPGSLLQRLKGDNANKLMIILNAFNVKEHNEDVNFSFLQRQWIRQR